MSTTGLTWVKSSYSGSEGDNCIEVAVSPGAVRVRDSKDIEAGELAASPVAWSAFVAYAVDVQA